MTQLSLLMVQLSRANQADHRSARAASRAGAANGRAGRASRSKDKRNARKLPPGCAETASVDAENWTRAYGRCSCRWHTRLGHSTETGGLMRSKLLTQAGERTFAIIFDTGDEAISGLTEFAKQQSLTASHFTAIGGFSDVTL